MDYQPKWNFLLHFNLHLHVENLLYYLISISSALAILNMAPVFLLDGQWTCLALCDILLSNFPKTLREKISKSILWSVSCLFVINLICATIKIFL